MFKGDKLIVPKPLQPEKLEKIHEAYLGIVKCKSRIRQVLFWPGSHHRWKRLLQPARCVQNIPEQTQRNHWSWQRFPDQPWAKVGVALFELNNHYYLVKDDNFSKWPEVSKLDNLTAKNVISDTKSQISRHGISEEVITDNGPQFACAVSAQFTKDYICHQTYSIQSLSLTGKWTSRKNCKDW